MTEIEQLKKDILEIKERNKKVEQDKAWETSLTRKFLIATLTYIVIVVFFSFGGFSKPLLNAIVPTLGFLLSTTSVSFVKNKWIQRKNLKSK